MKRFFSLFTIIMLFFLSVNADSLSTYNASDTVSQQALQIKEISESSTGSVSDLTLVVNAVNNIITWTSIMIATLTLFIGLCGFFGYHQIKQNMEKNAIENTKIVDNKIEELNKKKKEIDKYISLTQTILEKTNIQEKYMYKANQYLYEALDKIANQIEDTKTANAILNEILHNFQVTNLYSSKGKKVFAALAYLQANGTLEDIEHLEFYSSLNGNSDSNSAWAREIIGVIKHKNA